MTQFFRAACSLKIIYLEKVLTHREITKAEISVSIIKLYLSEKYKLIIILTMQLLASQISELKMRNTLR